MSKDRKGFEALTDASNPDLENIRSAFRGEGEWKRQVPERARQPAAIGKEAAWIRMDHLRQAQQAPFLCRVEPSYRPGLDLVPIFLAAPLANEASKPAPSVEQDERGALTCRQIESVTYEEYAKRRGDESDLDCILKVVKRCLGVADEPRNVEGMTRAEFGQHLNVCLQHDNVRRKERGIPEMTSDAMEAEIKERVERNYPAKCQGCAAFDNPDALDVHFVQGCEGCKARMQKVAGFGPLCDARAASTSANVAQLDMSLEARLTDAEADVKRLHAEKMELWNQVHGYSANVAQVSWSTPCKSCTTPRACQYDGCKFDVAQGAEATCGHLARNNWSDGSVTCHDCNATLKLAAPPAQTALTDTQRLDWIDATNAPFKMGWQVSIAPAGNVSIGSVIQLGGARTSIREAIDAALTADQSASGDKS